MDQDGKVGVIDFNETCYLDEAADFMDVNDNKLCVEMLNHYGGNEILREKVMIRRMLRPLIVFGNYAKRGDKRKVNKLVRQIRVKLLES